ncbi:MAG TPA: tocopherol cyclase family protein [Polyangiaceae bacterium]
MRLSSEKLSSGSAWAERVRYDARAAEAHVESWFLKANDPRGRRAVWLKWTIWAGARAPGSAVAEAWAVAFGTSRGHVATKTTVPFGAARFSHEGIDATVDGCTLTRESARGRVESGGRAIAYDLRVAPIGPPLVHYPARWMYERPLPKQKILSPVPDARVSGTVEIDGERWDLDGWPGMIGHNWGSQHTELYAWAHCNAWDDGEDVVLEGFSGRPRVGGVLVPTTTMVSVVHHGSIYRLNVPLRNAGSISPRRWRFRARSRRMDVSGELWADTEDFVGLFYPNPDGTLCHCLNSKLAHAEITLRVEGRAPRTLRSQRAALEIGTRDPNHGVRMYV